MHLLNYNEVVIVRVSFGFAINLALSSSSCSRDANWLSESPKVSSVCIPIIPNRGIAVDIRR